MPAKTVPPTKTRNTSTPATAVTRTTIYGRILIRLYGCSPELTAPSDPPKITRSTKVITAGTIVNQRFNLNLSFISQPCVRVDAMVVSEMIDKLSPSIAPPTRQPRTSPKGVPDFSAIATAIGPTAAQQPTDVPVAVEIKAEIRNTPAAKYCGGIYVSPKLTVESIPPIALHTTAKPPANRKIIHIIKISGFPQPSMKVLNLSLNFPFNKANATIIPMIEANGAGN